MAKQGLKKGQVTAKRAYAIADSLDNREKSIDIFVKNRVGLRPINDAGRNRLNEYVKNKADANRIRSAADKAVAKAQAGRDKPLPSSDGILSTIKNWFE